MPKTSVPPKRLRDKLKQHFGFGTFRPGQAQAVNSALAGRNVVVVMPTGSGKTLCFQLPALELDGMTVVVSPLISLMKDQTDRLRERGIRVAEFNSSIPLAQQREAEASLAAGECEFVYTTPERIADPEFRSLLKRQPIDLFVVDEAHCVSHWGHDFRPEFLVLGEAIRDLGSPPVCALTASATPDVVDEIRQQLHIPDADVVHTGFFRPNLHLGVWQAQGDREKRNVMLQLVSSYSGSGIVYVATVKAVEDLTGLLEAAGHSVAGYHGRMPARRRHECQDRFMSGEIKTMVATNAFGLGIDKPDIRYVIHYHMPGSLEAFYQEFGRAGRDGEPAVGTLIYDSQDRQLQRYFQGGRYPDASDLVNAYHVLQRLHQHSEPPTLAEIEAISPLSKSRMKVCLALFSNRRIVRSEPGRRYRLAQADLTQTQLVRAGQSYRERQELDQLKLQRIVDYAEQRSCRWRMLLDYFGSEERSGELCGQCDRCDLKAKAAG